MKLSFCLITRDEEENLPRCLASLASLADEVVVSGFSVPRCVRYEGRSGEALAPYGHAAFRWFRCYLLRRGFLDGPQGWRIARIIAREAFLKHALLRRRAGAS